MGQESEIIQGSGCCCCFLETNTNCRSPQTTQSLSVLLSWDNSEKATKFCLSSHGCFFLLWFVTSAAPQLLQLITEQPKTVATPSDPKLTPDLSSDAALWGFPRHYYTQTTCLNSCRMHKHRDREETLWTQCETVSYAMTCFTRFLFRFQFLFKI